MSAKHFFALNSLVSRNSHGEEEKDEKKLANAKHFAFQTNTINSANQPYQQIFRKSLNQLDKAINVTV